MPRRLSLFRPLSHPNFRLFWIANVGAGLGTLIQAAGAAWLMMLITSSSDMVALVQAAAALPYMLVSVTAGVIADNYNRRKVMISAVSFLLVVSALLATITAGGMITPWILLFFTFLIGSGSAFYYPSMQASYSELVPRDDLPSAIALGGLGYNLTRSVGPALGGLIVTFVGSAATFAVNGLAHLALFVVLLRWKPPQDLSKLPREGFRTAFASGIQYAAMSPDIQRIFLRGFTFGLTAISIIALFPIIIRDQLNGNAILFGLLYGCFGLGAVMGALIGSRIRIWLTSELLSEVCFLTLALCAAVTSFSTSPWPMAFVLMLGGAAWLLVLSLFSINIQISTPRWIVGRMLSMQQMASFGSMALGAWIWGEIAERHGIKSAMLSASVTLIMAAIVGRYRPLALREPQHTDLDTNPYPEPIQINKANPSSGKGAVIVTIEYIIGLEDNADFLRLMSEHSMLVRRNGGRQWRLMHDVSSPRRWLESYRLQSWNDYLRFGHRIQKENENIISRLNKLQHCGSPAKICEYIEQSVRSDNPPASLTPIMLPR